MTGSGPLGPPELEALRALAAPGCADAVGALARLLGRPVAAEPPDVAAGADAGALAESVATLGPELVAVGLRLEGLLAGHLVVALPHAGAARLAGLLGAPPAPGGGWSRLAESAVMETGNIVGSAFVSAMARRAGGRILLSVPALARGDGRACLDRLVGPAPPDVTLATRFTAPAPDPLEGLILVMPDARELPNLLGTPNLA